MKTIFPAIVAASILVAWAAEQASAAELWHIKCFTARGQTLPVKALGAGAAAYDVKAIAREGASLLDVKAIVPGSKLELPIKVVPTADENAAYFDVKVIDKKNQLLPVKAITVHGKILGVKAFESESGDYYDIKCLGESAKKLALKAISPQGQVFDVKGIKDLPGQEELDVEVLAHVKARPQGSNIASR